MKNDNELLANIDKLHTTKLGLERIQRNLNIVGNPVEYCKEIILSLDSNIVRKGKNFYCSYSDIVITINSYSYTIITAHKKK